MASNQENAPRLKQTDASGAPNQQGLMDLPFFLLTVMLTLIGLIMMFSASYARAYRMMDNATYYFLRQAIFAVAGIAVIVILSHIPSLLFWKMISPYVMLAAIGLLVLVLAVGSSGGGAKRWLVIGIRFQPSEIAKFALILFLAMLATQFREKMKNPLYGVLFFLLPTGAVAGLLYLEPHLSATVIICILGVVMMFLGGVKLRYFFILLLLGGAFILLFQDKLMGYAQERLTAWQDPWSDASDDGYQIVQSLYAIGSGGLFGLGFGRSRQKYLYLPEEHNDYIFSIVCEELGFVGALLIILLFVLLIVRGYWIAIHAKDRFGALLAAGLTTLLALQVFFNIGVVTNFLPATGISLPFFSYGGTALLLQLGEMGIILKVSRTCGNNLL